MIKKKIISILTFLFLVPTTAWAALENPLGTTDIRVVAGNIIKAVLALSGSAALLMFIWGGVQWIMSQGVKDKIEKGQKTIIWAVLGLLFIFIAYVILYALLYMLGTVTTTES
jgi:hypothetical protein